MEKTGMTFLVSMCLVACVNGIESLNDEEAPDCVLSGDYSIEVNPLNGCGKQTLEFKHVDDLELVDCEGAFIMGDHGAFNIFCENNEKCHAITKQDDCIDHLIIRRL